MSEAAATLRHMPLQKHMSYGLLSVFDDPRFRATMAEIQKEIVLPAINLVVDSIPVEPCFPTIEVDRVAAKINRWGY
uniref:Tail assembly chaperone n=1 Tax=Mycolicibacterium phage Alyssa1 TaxID=3240801 RepID=A0AB39U1R7_9CAUD